MRDPDDLDSNGIALKKRGSKIPSPGVTREWGKGNKGTSKSIRTITNPQNCAVGHGRQWGPRKGVDRGIEIKKSGPLSQNQKSKKEAG